MDKLKSSGKPFDISKRAVWEAWGKVKANKGAPGADGVSVAGFEKDLKGNLCRPRFDHAVGWPGQVRAAGAGLVVSDVRCARTAWRQRPRPGGSA